MDNLLEEALKSIAKEVVSSLKNRLHPPNRILLGASSEINNPVLVLNYLENCFFNTQFMIDHRIPIGKQYYYGRKIGSQQRDYVVDLAEHLKKYKLRDSNFLSS